MLESLLAKRVRDYCARTFEFKIQCVADHPFRPLVNNRCQVNAQAAVLQGDAVASGECVMITKDRATLHYVSLGKDGRYFDGTLGPAWAGGDYRLLELLREFPENDASARLVAKKAQICRAALPYVPAWTYDPDKLL